MVVQGWTLTFLKIRGVLSNVPTEVKSVSFSDVYRLSERVDVVKIRFLVGLRVTFTDCLSLK